jgi:hypothetical protein
MSTIVADLKLYFGWRSNTEDQTEENEAGEDGKKKTKFAIFLALDNHSLIAREAETEHVGKTINSVKDFERVEQYVAE